MKIRFTQRIINLWNSQPSYAVNFCSVNSFKTNIDKCWSSQDVYYDSIRPDSLLRFWHYINHLLTYLLNINVILSELETVVTVTNSLYSTVIQSLQRRG